MKAFLKLTTAAAALLGSVALMGGPASAAEWGVDVGGGPVVGFDVHTGGYCDHWGCPGHYWAYPIYYGPVFYDGEWFRGPAYTRVVDGEHWYWIHGGWHRDQWEGSRPQWARSYHYGPALGLDYYREHGFRVSDHDRQHWNDRGNYRPYHTGYTEDRYGNDEGRYRNDDDQYRSDPDRYAPNNTTYTQDRYGNDEDRYRSGRDRDQYQHTGYDNGRDRGNSDHSQYRDDGSERGQDQSRHTGYENGRDRDNYDHGPYRSDEPGQPQKTGFEQQRSYGHPQTPPITSRQNSSSHSHPASDRTDRQDQNGPTE